MDQVKMNRMHPRKHSSKCNVYKQKGLQTAMKNHIMLFPLCAIVIFSALALAQPSIPTISSYATDNAGILSPHFTAELEHTLEALEKETNGVQYVVFIESSYPQEYSLDEYTLKIAEQNKIGKGGNDNGILLYIAIDDHEYRWEVGYGVESTLNSAMLGRISREYLVPAFQEGDYEKGILEVVNLTARALLSSEDADILKQEFGEEPQPGLTKEEWIVIGFVVFFIVIVILISLDVGQGGSGVNRGFGRSPPLMGGGGFGGGLGGGGFSGGGGRFGGGGFRGKW